jgi:Xaa-Pro aminopeptidase
MIKDAGELRAIRQAVRIAEEAFGRLVAGGVKALAGKTERRIAADLEYLMRRCGADAAAFPTVVAGGANGSRPHHLPGDRRVRRGEPVLLDFGVRRGGYHSDLTRVVFLGRIPRKLGEAYEIVRRAQQAGIRAVGPGVSCRSPDVVARGIIEQAGYGQAFLHGLGHGLGLEVHEGPTLGAKATGRLRAGMVVTVEPGIYLPGVGGIRIEDDVVVTAAGRRRISTLPTEIEAMLLR